MPGKRAARPPRSQRARRIAVAAVVALVLAGVGVWAAVAANSGGNGGDEGNTVTSKGNGTSAKKSSPSPSPTGSSDAPGGSSATVPAALRTCAATVKEADEVVAAASQGVSHWHTHVQSRTDMLDGRMSVSMMDAMWKKTRLAGPADQAKFHAVLDSYEPTSACKKMADVPKTDQAAMKDCATRYAAATKAVDAAEAAMGDWKSHLDNMAAFAAGKMSSSQAQTLWVAAWKGAPPHIDDYESARQALDAAPACSAG